MDAKVFLDSYPASWNSNSVLVDDPAFRLSLYKIMFPKPSGELLPLVRELFQKEAAYRADESNDGEYYENLYVTALFLNQIGDFDDVIPMWDAKHIDMDTGFGFDIQFLVGRGVAETIEHLHQNPGPETEQIVEYLQCCQNAGDFENLDEWLADTIEYHVLS